MCESWVINDTFIIYYFLCNWGQLLYILNFTIVKKQPTYIKCRLLGCYSVFISSEIFVVTLLTATDNLSKILFTSESSLFFF